MWFKNWSASWRWHDLANNTPKAEREFKQIKGNSLLQLRQP